MTTPSSPDGQTPQQAPASDPPNAGAQQQGGEEWRNKDEVKRIIAKRDEAATVAKTEKARADALAAELAEIKAKQMQADGNLSGLLDGEKKARAEIEAKAKELSDQLEQRSRQDRRREVVDTILDGAHPQRKEELRLMLAGLHESGDVDLYAEDAKAEGRKALDKLRKRLPSYFTPSGTATGATQSGPGRDFSNVDWMQLTPEEQRNVSPEDFRKHFAGRGTRTRGSSALFGQPPTRK